MNKQTRFKEEMVVQKKEWRRAEAFQTYGKDLFKDNHYDMRKKCNNVGNYRNTSKIKVLHFITCKQSVNYQKETTRFWHRTCFNSFSAKGRMQSKVI
jgi:hypothetical protein